MFDWVFHVLLTIQTGYIQYHECRKNEIENVGATQNKTDYIPFSHHNNYEIWDTRSTKPSDLYHKCNFPDCTKSLAALFQNHGLKQNVLPLRTIAHQMNSQY